MCCRSRNVKHRRMLSFLLLLRLGGLRSLPNVDLRLAGFFSVSVAYLQDLHRIACLSPADPWVQFAQGVALIEERFPLLFSASRVRIPLILAVASCTGPSLLAAQYALFPRVRSAVSAAPPTLDAPMAAAPSTPQTLRPPRAAVATPLSVRSQAAELQVWSPIAISAMMLYYKYVREKSHQSKTLSTNAESCKGWKTRARAGVNITDREIACFQAKTQLKNFSKTPTPGIMKKKRTTQPPWDCKTRDFQNCKSFAAARQPAALFLNKDTLFAVAQVRVPC